MDFQVADQRILRAVSAVVSVTKTDQNGTAHNADGTMTVGVTRADGTVVLAPGTGTTHGATGVYSANLGVTDTATLDFLTCTWTDSGDSSVSVTYVEVVGGFYFSLAEARASDDTLTDVGDYPDALILAKRAEVEYECERITAAAFVPRYRRIVTDGDGTPRLTLPDNLIRTIRTVRVYTDLSAGTFRAFTDDQLGDLALDSDSNMVERTDFNIFEQGRGNIAVEYEYGYDRPPPDLKTATLIRLRERLNQKNTGIPDKASRFQETGGIGYNLNAVTAFKTGIDDVDGPYERYSLRSQGTDGMIPASRRLEFNVQGDSLFHGNR